MNNPSIMSHVSIGTNDFARAATFYDAVLATIGAKRIIEHSDEAVAYGRMFPEFWVNLPLDDQPAGVGNGSHFSFFANSKAEVDAFYQTALDNGASPEGAPGPRPEYGTPYYGCFVRDLDGHKIEATFWDTELDTG
ncbi:MAG: VOC family protein [Actinomycetota bacterium]